MEPQNSQINNQDQPIPHSGPKQEEGQNRTKKGVASKANYTQVLMQAGLNGSQALIYETLLKTGPLKASSLATRTPFKRQLTYKLLEELVEIGLVVKQEQKGKVAIFEPAHPLKLKDFIEKQQEKAKAAELAVSGMMEKLTLDYNSVFGRPGVKFYEGKEGIIKIYETLLENGKNIDSIEDKGEMASFIPEYSRKYPKLRVKRNIFNRVIAPSDNPINESSKVLMRETRSIPTESFPFRMDIKIAGQLVSLITFHKDNPVGILIDNPEIADNFKILFDLIWGKLDIISSTKKLG